MHGQTIPAGKLVLAMIGSANRDPQAVPRARPLRRHPRPQPAPGVRARHSLLPGRAAGAAGGADRAGRFAGAGRRDRAGERRAVGAAARGCTCTARRGCRFGSSRKSESVFRRRRHGVTSPFAEVRIDEVDWRQTAQLQLGGLLGPGQKCGGACCDRRRSAVPCHFPLGQRACPAPFDPSPPSTARHANVYRPERRRLRREGDYAAQ